MYAVVNTGGKQYKVQQGEVLRVEKIPGDIGAPVTFDRVLMFSDGENVQIGQPVLDDVAVQGHIVEQGKAKKIIVFKYKRRKRFRRKQGHRQEFTAVQIDSITAGKVKAKTSDLEAEAPQAEAKKADTKTEKAAPKKETTAKTEAKKDTPKKAASEKAPAKKKAPEKAEAKKAAAKKTDDPKTDAKESQPVTQKAEKKDGDDA